MVNSPLSQYLNGLSGEEFEHLCNDLLIALDFRNIEWLKGSADEGRDFESIGSTFGLKWFFECKRLSRGISVKDIADKVLWSEAEGVDVMVILSSSHLTPSAKRWLQKRPKSAPVVLDWSDARFELLCYSYPDVLKRRFDGFVVPLEFNGRSFSQEVLKPFLVERGGFQTFTSFPLIEEMSIREKAGSEVAAAFTELTKANDSDSDELTEELERRVCASKDAIENIVQQEEPDAVGFDYIFSEDCKRALFAKFCTEEGASAFFRRNLWIDRYLLNQRSRAEALLAAGEPTQALEVLSGLRYYITQKAEVPYKVVKDRSSSHCHFRIPRNCADEQALDELLEFERSIALAQLKSKSTGLDRYEGWELVESAVNARTRQAFKEYSAGSISHDDFLGKVNGAFLEVFELSGILEKPHSDRNSKILWTLIKAILYGISSAGFLYSMYRMYSTMNPQAMQNAYDDIQASVDSTADEDIRAFKGAIVAADVDRERLYSQLYSYVFHYVHDLDSWSRYY